MEKDRIVYPYIGEYMQKLRRRRGGALGELEERARRENYPIASPETSDLLEILCYLKKPERILEIGTCIGFAALLMEASSPGGVKIDTIERNPAMLAPAKKNFARFSRGGITLHEGNAVDLLPGFEGGYDMIFLDAAKGQYPVFFKECRRLLKKDGIFVSDNVFFNGYAAEGTPDVRRNWTIVRRLNQYLDMLESDEDFKTVILPISDGVTLSYRMGKTDFPETGDRKTSEVGTEKGSGNLAENR